MATQPIEQTVTSNTPEPEVSSLLLDAPEPEVSSLLMDAPAPPATPTIQPWDENMSRIRELEDERRSLLSQDFWITDESKNRIGEIKKEKAQLLVDPGMTRRQFTDRLRQQEGITPTTNPLEIATGISLGKAVTQFGLTTVRGALTRGATFGAPTLITEPAAEMAAEVIAPDSPWANLAISLGLGLTGGNILEVILDRKALNKINTMAPKFFSKHLEELVPPGTTDIYKLERARLKILKGRIDKGDQLALEEAEKIIKKIKYAEAEKKAALTKVPGGPSEQTVEAKYKELRHKNVNDLTDEDLEAINSIAKARSSEAFDETFENVKTEVNDRLAADAYLNHPVIDLANNITDNGGFNIHRMRLMIGDDNVEILNRKYPGLITADGQVDPIKKAVARDMDVDEMVKHLMEMPDIGAMRKSIGRDLDFEWKMIYQDEFFSRVGGAELKMWQDIGGADLVKKIRSAVKRGVSKVEGDSIRLRKMADEVKFLRKIGGKAGRAIKTTERANARIAELAAAAEVRDSVNRKQGLLKTKGRMKNALKPSSAPEEYQEQLHNLLRKYMGESAVHSPDAPNIREFLDGKVAEGTPMAKLMRENYDDMFDLPDRVPDMQDLSVGEYKKFGSMINDLRRMGMSQRKIDNVSRKTAIEDYIHNVTLKADKTFGRKFKNTSLRDFIGGKKLSKSQQADLRSEWLADLKRPEFILRELDGWDDFGEAQKLFRTAKLAEEHNFQISKVLRERWQEILKEYAGDLGKKKFKKAFWEERFDDSLSDVSMSKENMLVAAAMTGNDTNKAALRRSMRREDGEEWSDIAMNRFFRENMTEEDWKFVRNIWKMTDEMYNMMGETYKNVTGRTLPKVNNYYPIIPNYKFNKNRNLESKDIEDAFMSLPHMKKIPAHIQNRFFKTRTDGTEAVRMDLDALAGHFRDVSHSVSHWERTNDMRKVINNPKFEKMVSENLGAPKYRALQSWMDDLIKPGGSDAPTLRGLRGNVTVAMLGLKLSTAMAQTLSLAPAIPRVGAKNLATAGARFMMNPLETHRAIREVSEQMAVRNNAWQREIRDLMKTKEAAQIRKMGSVDRNLLFSFIRSVDAVVADTVWYAGWQKGMQKYGGNQNRAIAYADQSVRLTQPQSSLKDLPAIMRSPKEWKRLMTMFYSYYSVLHNQSAEIMQRGKMGDASKGEVMAALSYMYLVPAMMRSAGVDRDVSLENMGKNVATHVAGGLPFVRDLASSAVMGYDYQVSPVGSQIDKAIDQVGRGQNLIKDMVEGNASLADIGLTGIEIGANIGSLKFPIPSSQIMTITRGIKAYMDDENIDIFDALVKQRKQEEE